MPDDVARIEEFLTDLTEEELRHRYDPARMMELGIYPEVWNGDADEEFGYLTEAFERLRAFVIGAREAGDAIVIWLD
jgi:hypothetical protein